MDERLDMLGTEQPRSLRGKAAIADAILAYEAYKRTLRIERWAVLAAADARSHRPLWASTGVKDPAYEDTRYVIELVAPGTVNILPQPTLTGCRRSRRPGDRPVRGRAPGIRTACCTGRRHEGSRGGIGTTWCCKFQQSWRALTVAIASEFAAHRSEF